MSAINLLYTHAGWMGYGRFGTNLHKALELEGVEVFDKAPGEQFVPEFFTLDARHEGRANVSCLCSVPSHGLGWWKGQTPVCFTMWEAMRLPESFRESMYLYETIVVPSQHNLELFSDWHQNVKYVPLGVDPDVWHYQARKPPGSQFRFLIGGSGARKGGDLAVEAFKKLWGKDGSWGDGPVPWLVMKTPKAEQHYGQRIEVQAGRLTDQQEVDLYAGAHCYLQPSRGEGFGLQPLQAIVQGMPTILTDAHGHKAFSHLGLPISAGESKAKYFIYGDAGTWWEPSLDELCDQMLDVYENYDDHVERSRRNARLARPFTWQNTARGLIDAVGGHQNLGPYVGPEEWFAVDRLKYKLITSRDWPCDIAGTRYAFKKGVEYWALADVKRILFENGVLDPSCLDDDDPDSSGLTDAQIEQCGKYRAQHETCPTCGRST